MELFMNPGKSKITEIETAEIEECQYVTKLKKLNAATQSAHDEQQYDFTRKYQNCNLSSSLAYQFGSALMYFKGIKLDIFSKHNSNN